MKTWTFLVTCSLSILTMANCQELGERCKTPYEKPGTLQKQSSCPSLQNTPVESEDDITVCCPHRISTRANTFGRSNTRQSRRKTRGTPSTSTKRVATKSPNLRFAGCGEGGPPELKRRTRSIQYYDRSRNVTDDYEETDDPSREEEYDYADDFNISTSMIVGGSVVHPHTWPMVSCLMRRRQVFCGSTIITNHFVITAAHCVRRGRRTITDFTVRVAAHSSTDGITHRVSGVYPHRDYRDYHNDIALIRLASAIIYTVHAKPVCLPTAAMDKSTFDRKSVVIIGWGTMRAGGASSRELRQAVIQVVPRSTCDAAYSRLYGVRTLITSKQLCANSKGKDTCQGDSGGPLLIYDGYGKWSLIGITSFGQGCAQLRYPGVYTKVSSYLTWIQSIISA